MHSLKPYTNRRRANLFAVSLTLIASFFWWNNSDASRVAQKTVTRLAPVKLNLPFQALWEKRLQLKRGETLSFINFHDKL